MNFLIAALVCLVPLSRALPQQRIVNSCQGGQEYWCQNEATATECGVLEFCELQFPARLIKNNAVEEVQSADPIKIELYYESFCGGCQNFILKQLYPTFQKLYSKGVFEIALYPYGNAQEKQDGQKWEFDCQHGEKECQMNLVETCALHLLSHPQQFMPYIECVEHVPTIQRAQYCAEKLHVEWGPIAACYNGSEGNFLEHQMAMKTDALVPKHKYVPWIVVDGQHTEEMQTEAQIDLMAFLCKQYKGVKPEECQDVQKEKKDQRCFKEINV